MGMSGFGALRLTALAVLCAYFGALAPMDSIAQQASTTQPAGDGDAAATEDGDAQADEAPPEDVYTEEELDDLVAPVALYPDALLAQVLVAATYPLDVVKAQRWAGENKDLAADKRADATEAEGWDPSIAVLAAGFPTVLERMAKEIDWTEQLGDAMIVQDGDVLDAVQRQAIWNPMKRRK